MDMTSLWFLATGIALIFSLPDADRTGNSNGTEAAAVVLWKS